MLLHSLRARETIGMGSAFQVPSRCIHDFASLLRDQPNAQRSFFIGYHGDALVAFAVEPPNVVHFQVWKLEPWRGGCLSFVTSVEIKVSVFEGFIGNIEPRDLNIVVTLSHDSALFVVSVMYNIVPGNFPVDVALVPNPLFHLASISSLPCFSFSQNTNRPLSRFCLSSDPDVTNGYILATCVEGHSIVLVYFCTGKPVNKNLSSPRSFVFDTRREWLGESCRWTWVKDSSQEVLNKLKEKCIQNYNLLATQNGGKCSAIVYKVRSMDMEQLMLRCLRFNLGLGISEDDNWHHCLDNKCNLRIHRMKRKRQDCRISDYEFRVARLSNCGKDILVPVILRIDTGSDDLFDAGILIRMDSRTGSYQVLETSKSKSSGILAEKLKGFVAYLKKQTSFLGNSESPNETWMWNHSFEHLFSTKELQNTLLPVHIVNDLPSTNRTF